MKAIISVLIAFAAVTPALASVKPGENILSNGTLEADQTDRPLGWSVYIRDRNLVKWMATGGPDALPYYRFESSSPEPHDTTVRQGGIKLVSNGVYCLSAKVRTKDFKYKNAGVVVASGGWKKSRAVGNIPKDTGGQWKELSCKFESFGEKGVHQVIFFASGFTGTFDVADARLTAENDIARAATEPSVLAAASNKPRLVPFAPLLWEIPKSKREVEFRFFGKVPSGRLEDYDLELSVDEAARRSPLSKGPIIVPLPEGAERGVMTVRGVERKSGTVICSEQFTFRTVDAPEIPSSCGRRLNNLSTELLNKSLGVGCSRYGESRSLGEKEKIQKNSKTPKLPEAKAKANFTFTAPRSGWLYIAVRRPRPAAVRVTLDGREVIGGDTPRSETFREVEVGPHEIAVTGAAGGRLIVRAIADIFSYCPCGEWSYEERHVLPAVTSENGGRIPTNAIPSFLSRGYRWIANLNTTGLSADALVKKLSECDGMIAPHYAGVTCDEQFFAYPQSIDSYTKGLKAYDFAHSPERVIYTWIVGKPVTPSLDHAFIATSINASRGRGKILLEMYCRTKGATEEEARLHLKRYVTDTLDRYRAWYPLSVASACVAFGNFNKMPILSLAHHPEVDYKYYLDMQLNLAANDPSCRDLGAVGYWGCNYADDEMRRWSSALMRHYVVEGNTNMLSAAYGYRYCPGHLQDGDFSGGGVRGAPALPAPWKATGNVRTDSHRDFARRSQCRWGGNGGVGDTFAVLTREDGAPATVSQTAKGLEPGRTYCLQFATFDVKDVKANRIAPRRFGIDVRLGTGVEIRKDLSWTHVDKRVKGRYDFNNDVARINLHHVVFTARAVETEVVFDNSAAKLGEELGINAVSLNPYFEGSAGDSAHGREGMVSPTNGTVACARHPEQLPPLPDGAFTYAVIPDTQLYHGEGTYHRKGKPKPTGPTTNPAFESRVNWIVDHLASERIFFVSHVGDIVDFKSPQQWSLASNIMARLDGKVPYGISPGNHDISGNDTRQFNAYFPRSRYAGNSWYVGGFDGCLDEKGKRTVCAGNSDSCQLAEAGGVKFVFLHLECNAPEPVLKWADEMLDRYADRKAIICTHMCVGYKTKAISDKHGKYGEKPRPDEWFGVMDWSKCHGKNGLSGEQMWEKCFSRHKNIILVVSGDQSGAISARETRKGIHGNTVHLTLQDYPRRNDDDDWIRLYRFRKDMSAIDVWTYSPRQKAVCEKARHKIGREHHVFTLPLD